MPWTYSGDPGTSNKDWVRWRIGDTDSSDQLQQDEEITAALNSYGTKYRAAAEICKNIAAKLARRVDKSVGDLRLSRSQQYEMYLKLADTLMAEGFVRSKPYAGGISKDDKKTDQQDTDRVKPAFQVDQFDHPDLDKLERLTSTQ